MNKKLRVLPLVFAFAAASSAFAAIPKEIKIGTDPTYAPFESKNSSGELVGFDIDIAKELCKRIDTKCTFVESDFDALIPSLKAKKSMPLSPLSPLLKNAKKRLPSPINSLPPIPV